MTEALYQASPIKRHRATKADMQARHSALWKIVTAMKPMTVRQVYYQATVRNIVEKTEAGYNKVQNDLVQMRKSGALPYVWLADNTRWQRKPNTFDSVEQALQETAQFYRKSLWNDADCYVEIWLEKDALAGVEAGRAGRFGLVVGVAHTGQADELRSHGADLVVSDLAELLPWLRGRGTGTVPRTDDPGLEPH